MKYYTNVPDRTHSRRWYYLWAVDPATGNAGTLYCPGYGDPLLLRRWDDPGENIAGACVAAGNWLEVKQLLLFAGIPYDEELQGKRRGQRANT